MDIRQLDYILGVGNFVDYLIVLDEKGLITLHRIFGKDGAVLEVKRSLGKTPMEVFPSMTETTCPAYRTLYHGEKILSKVLKVMFDGIEYECTVNIMLVTRHGRTIGVVCTGKILDSEYFRASIDIPERIVTAKHRLYDVTDIIGSSLETQRLRLKIKRVAASPSSVLIYGETGTGKELVAQSIHTSSPRRDAPFISQNCAAIPQTLLESTFFGTTKGSFTGAENRAGVFELADGGTVFLDELNSMDLGMQAKLLKAIEEKTITRVGGAEPKRMDVRIITAINQPPDQCLRDRTIRADLFYRLAGVQINLPPLRERKSDLPDLLRHFMQQLNGDQHGNSQDLSQQVLALFEAYDWPGNIRELKNSLGSAFLFNTGPTIELDDLPEHLKNNEWVAQSAQASQVESLNDALDLFEKQIIQAKAASASNLADLAERLQISRQTLNYKLKKYGLAPFKD